MTLKPDAAQIKQILHNLANETWLGPGRKRWPFHLFRTDHVEAAAKILNSKKILSRAKAEASHVMTHDSACSDVIAKTSDTWKHCVRLYFRPRSPTQYNTEGFRPRSSYYSNDAHCPMPIVLMLNASAILTRGDSKFSDGNLASPRAAVDNTADFLRKLPFHKIYHDRQFSADDRDDIIFHRHAEVIIPDELVIDTTNVSFIGCRTTAEYDTLIELLTPEAREYWHSKIGLSSQDRLHERRWSFVEQVSLALQRCDFTFNIPSKSSGNPSGPFHVEFKLTEECTGLVYQWQGEQTLGEQLSFRIGQDHFLEQCCIVELRLDNRIAYKHTFQLESLPF